VLSQVTVDGANELVRSKLPDTFGVDDWNLLELGLVSSKFFLILNKSDLIFDMQDLAEADGLFGTIGFGTNGMIAEFSDIEMDCLSKSAFVKYIESLRKVEEFSSELGSEDLESSTEEESSEDVAVTKEKPLPSYAPCVTLSSQSERVKWVSENISATSNVVFCPACCDTLAMPSNSSECRTECEGAIAMAPAAPDLFDSCLASEDGMENPELYQACVLCIDDMRNTHPEVAEETLTIKKVDCNDKFRNANKDQKGGSFAQNAEEEA